MCVHLTRYRRIQQRPDGEPTLDQQKAQAEATTITPRDHTTLPQEELTTAVVA